jgi:nitrogen regulatory protein PII 1
MFLHAGRTNGAVQAAPAVAFSIASRLSPRGTQSAMVMVQAIVRPEKSFAVVEALLDAGFPALTKYDVAGRGKQRGIRIGEVTYDELPKEMLMIVVSEEDAPLVIDTIERAARTNVQGAFGDGKIFVLPVQASYTISSGARDAEAVAEAVEA